MRFGVILALVQGCQTRVEKMHFCRLFRNWNFKVDLNSHLRDKHGHLFFMRFGVILALVQGCETKVENKHFCRLSQNWVLKVDFDTHLRDKHGHLYLWDLELFFPHSRLVKPMFKICTFIDILEIQILK